MTQPLTPKQQRVRDYLRRHIEEHGVAPSVRDIGREIGVRSTCTVVRHLQALERKGAIARDRYAHRGCRLVGDDAMPATKRELLAMVRDLRAENAMLRAALEASQC